MALPASIRIDGGWKSSEDETATELLGEELV